MPFTLAELPYPIDALAPLISGETLEYHYGKHHQAYLANLNRLITGTIFEESSLEELICKADGSLFDNASQVWNHSFYWNCLSSKGGGEPDGALKLAIRADFGSFAAFRQEFSASAAGNFGSGWTWLVKNMNGRLSIINTANAGNPLSNGLDDGLTPLLTCDVWEHAYYIDYRNARVDYIEAFWKLLNWKFAAGNFSN